MFLGHGSDRFSKMADDERLEFQHTACVLDNFFQLACWATIPKGTFASVFEVRACNFAIAISTNKWKQSLPKLHDRNTAKCHCANRGHQRQDYNVVLDTKCLK